MHDIRPYLPELFNQPGTLLYIGARPDAHSWLEELIEAGNEVSILEVWEENIIGLVGCDLYPRLDTIHHCDVRDINSEDGIDIAFWGNFDYIFYWHGPEHLNLSEVQPTLEKLEKRTNRTLALACPWGKYPQDAHESNPYEQHRCTLYPHVFEIIGYETATDGFRDEPGSEIVAWKRK